MQIELQLLHNIMMNTSIGTHVKWQAFQTADGRVSKVRFQWTFVFLLKYTYVSQTCVCMYCVWIMNFEAYPLQKLLSFH